MSLVLERNLVRRPRCRPPVLQWKLAPDFPNVRSLPAPSLCQLDGPAVTGESLRP